MNFRLIKSAFIGSCLTLLSGCYSGPYSALVPTPNNTDYVTDCLFQKLRSYTTTFGNLDKRWDYSRTLMKRNNPSDANAWLITGRFFDTDARNRPGYWATVLHIQVFALAEGQTIVRLQHAPDWSYAGRGQLEDILNSYIPDCTGTVTHAT